MKDEKWNKLPSLNSKLKLTYVVSAIAISTLLIGVSLGMMVMSNPAPASAPPTEIDWEGLTVYKVNGIRYANPNDFDSIQDSLDEMTDGGLLVIPSGDYTSSTQIEVKYSGTAVVGVGWASHIECTAGHSGMYINEKSNVLIKDIWFEGAGQFAGGSDLGINILTSENITITNCRFTEWPNDPVIMHGPDTYHCSLYDSIISQCGEGPEIKGGNYNVIGGCQVSDITEEGIEVTMRPSYDEQSSNHLIANNIVNDVGQMGIWIYEQVSACTIIGNVINDTVTGIQIAGIAGYVPDNILLIGNTIAYSSSSGIRINDAGWENIRISENIIEWYNSYGIYLVAGGANLSIGGNFISNGYGATADAIALNSAAKNVTISDNVILEPNRYAINSPTPSLSVMGNTIRGGTVGVFLTSVAVPDMSTKVSDNRIESVTSVGIKLQNAGWANISLTGNHFNDIGVNAISSTVNGADLLISGNVISSMGGSLDAIVLSGTINGLLISENLISDTSRYAINLAVENAIVSNNIIRGVTSYGIYCSDATGSVISSNFIEGFTSSGIRLAATSDHIVISNNRFTEMPYGISESAGADWIYVLGNNFWGCTTGAYSLSGANNVYANNTAAS